MLVDGDSGHSGPPSAVSGRGREAPCDGYRRARPIHHQAAAAASHTGPMVRTKGRSVSLAECERPSKARNTTTEHATSATAPTPRTIRLPVTFAT